MSRDPLTRLEDIVEACQRIEDYIAEMDESSFGSDLKTQDAVIRQFEIAGEAVKTLPVELTETESAIPWKQIAGFRDILAHAYFAVDVSVVWDAAKHKAPQLMAAAQRLIQLK